MKYSWWIGLYLALLVFCISSSRAMPAAQNKPATVAEQNMIVHPQDAIRGADWLRAQGVDRGLGTLDLGVDSKGNAIKFVISADGQGIEIKLKDSGLEKALAADKENGGIMNKIKHKKDDAKGLSGLTTTDIFGPKFKRHDPESGGTMTAKSLGFGKIAKVNEFAGGGTVQYLQGTNLNPSDLRVIEQNAPVIKLLAEARYDDASKLYSSIHSGADDVDVGTSDPSKLALIQKVNATMDRLTAQEQTGAKTLHFKAENGTILAHLNDSQTSNIEKVLQSMSQERLFEMNSVTYAKDSSGKGIVTMANTVTAQDIEQFTEPLKVAIDTGDEKKVESFQKYKGITDLNLPKH